MAVPDHFFIVQQTFKAGQYDLTNHDDHAQFVDDVVVDLHGVDPNWGHVIKKPGQTQIHGHGEDSALYKLPNNKAHAVDFIGGAGGPDPSLRWGPDLEPFYTHADWLDPADHENGVPHPQPPPTYPSYEAMGGDAGGKRVTELIEIDYINAGKSGLDGHSGVWQWRTAYDYLTRKFATVDESIAAHQPEWRQALNDERIAQGKPPIAW